VLRDRSNSLLNTDAYFTYQDLADSYDPANIAGTTATVVEHKHQILTVHNSDGTTSSQDNTFTVTYSLVNQAGQWLVDDYSYVSATGFTGSASADAQPCT
jgi:hypothetical protein